MKLPLFLPALVAAACLAFLQACSSGNLPIDGGLTTGGTGGPGGSNNPPTGGSSDGGIVVPGTPGVFGGLSVFHRGGQSFISTTVD